MPGIEANDRTVALDYIRENTVDGYWPPLHDVAAATGLGLATVRQISILARQLDLLPGGPRRTWTPLDERGDQVLAFVRDYIVTNRWAPSMREIADALDVVPSTVKYAIDDLVDRGRLEVGDGARAMRLPNTRIVFEEDTDD